MADHDDSAVRRANAVRTYIANLEDEMDSCARQQAEMYRRADVFGSVFDEIAERRRNMAEGLFKLDLQMQRSGAYWLSDQQAETVLAKIAEVGADTERFCHYLGVDAVARIPYHRFDEALAELEAKRDVRAAA